MFLCPPDEYGRILGQKTRRLIQDQVKRAAHHNVIVFTGADRRVQVWQWAERQAGEQSMRVYEHSIGSTLKEAALLARLAAITFGSNEEAELTLTDVVRRLKSAFTDDHGPIQRGRHGRDGLRAYNLAELDKGIQFWWEQVLREPRMTAEQEYPLACAMQSGDAQARNRMITAHLHLVARIAWRVAGKYGCSLDDYFDLVQTANLEMMRLAPGFDPNEGVRFQTFLWPRLLKTLERILAGEEGPIPIPRYILDALPKFSERHAAAEDRLTHQLGRMPFESEVTDRLAAEYQVPPEKIARVLFIQEAMLSWDVLVAELHGAEQDAVEEEWKTEEAPSAFALMIDGSHHQAPSEAAINMVRREQLEIVLGSLTPRERDVLWMRYGFADGFMHTLEEVGQHFAVTRERVRQIELRALEKLRRMGPVSVNERCELVAAPLLKRPLMNQVSADDADDAI